MDKFNTVTTIVLATITALLAAEIYFLCSLYESVKRQYIATAKECLVQAEMIETVLRVRSNADVNGDDFKFALDLNIDKTLGRLPENKSAAGPVPAVDSLYASNRINLFQSVNTTMAYKLHEAASGVAGKPDFARLDSIFKSELNRVGLYPSRVAVLPPDSVNTSITRGMWSFSYSILPSTPVVYNAFISPPLGDVLRQTAGVAVSTLLIVAALAFAFFYLIRTVVRMKSLEEMKDDFTNNMTHELKTPIAVAYSANDTLLNYGKHYDPEKRERYLRMALEQLTRLGELVERILSMSMERRKTLVLDKEKIRLLPFIMEIVDTHSVRAGKPVDFDVTVDPESLEVTGDPSHLANVISNLIDNAMKYSGDKVRITIRGNASGISVADDGIGIPQRSMPFIFNKFYRVPSGNRQDVRGYGIGLYYVRSIVEKMGWSISAESSRGSGSVFTIHFNQDEKQNIACGG